MGWGKSQEQLARDIRQGLFDQAHAEVLKNWDRATERTYLAALLQEQERTNELLEQLVSALRDRGLGD